MFSSCGAEVGNFRAFLRFRAETPENSPVRPSSDFFRKNGNWEPAVFLLRHLHQLPTCFEARWPIFSCGVFPVVKTVPRFRGKNQDPRGKIPIPRKKYYGARGRRTSPASAVTDICRVHFWILHNQTLSGKNPDQKLLFFHGEIWFSKCKIWSKFLEIRQVLQSFRASLHVLNPDKW